MPRKTKKQLAEKLNQEQRDKLQEQIKHLLAQHPELRGSETLAKLQQQFIADVIGEDIAEDGLLRAAHEEKRRREPVKRIT